MRLVLLPNVGVQLLGDSDFLFMYDLVKAAHAINYKAFFHFCIPDRFKDTPLPTLPNAEWLYIPSFLHNAFNDFREEDSYVPEEFIKIFFIF